MGRLAKLKRELMLESNRRLLGETKSYLTEDEKEKIRLPFIKLVTKYKDALKGFIEELNTVVADENQFCANPKEAAKQAAESLDDFITRMSLDMKVKPEQVLEALYDKANSGLLKTIISVAKPLVSKFAGGVLSKEILDEIEQHMRTKYGAIGRGINSMMTEIMSKLNVKVDNIC